MSNQKDNLRALIKQRAGNRCEYCLSHQDYIMGWLQVDHIYPSVKGGEDSEDNLCLSCELCNQYKWTKTEELDPQSGVNVQLFNPRQQKWKEHFAWSEDGIRIIGLTACGRATAVALKLNNSLAITVRGNWVKAGWYPPTV
jgi:hypothetical protein